MKVISYYNGIPPKNQNQEKSELLKKFIQGVNAIGDQGIVHTNYDLVDCDVGVIQGWQHELGKDMPHLRLRKAVIDFQIKNKKYVCTADSNLFLYANPTNEPHHYLRYSFNGIFPNTGIYFDSIIDPQRWKQISHDLNIKIEDYKNQGSNIVICMQRNGGWSMGNVNVVSWLVETVQKIRKFSDRPIVVRPHPGDKRADITYLPRIKAHYQKDSKIRISDPGTSLDEDLKNCWAVINHNSSSIVGPLIMGHHAFITDPEKSQCAEVAHTDFSKIETPQEFNRQQWLERISMFHWKFSELEDGSAWRHMRQFVNF